MKQIVRFVVAAVIAASVVPASSARAQESKPAPPSVAAVPDEEATAEPAAPVLIGGEPVLWIATGVGPYTAAARAERISGRIHEAIRDRSLADITVTVTDTEGSSELRAGQHLLLVITQRDAALLGVSRVSLARQFAGELELAMRAERDLYSPATLIRNGVFGLVATVGLAVALWIIGRLTRRLRAVLTRRFTPHSESLRAIQEELLSDSRIARTVTGAMRALRIVLFLIVFDVYLTYVLGLFPWTRAVAVKLLDYAVTPVKAVGMAIIGYVPNALFLLVITAFFYAVINLVGLFFRQIERGRLVFPNFPAEWADPTNKIARTLLIAFGVVVAFPYLPASSSPAFAGVSVFVGVLFSLASSSALSNMIAGLVLTYTSAFRVGERVKVGDSFGDIIETSLLVTRVRTIKNESITIPNGIVLSSAVTNYSRAAMGLILHTSVTIGYDAPWRKIHDLLISAALDTPGVLADPKPFVWQTALNDFYVTYEINAYTATPRDMQDIYAALHSRIQDSFYEAGVEIMSPHVTSIRDGNTIAIPESYRPAEYRAPSFRVEDPSRMAPGK